MKGRVSRAYSWTTSISQISRNIIYFDDDLDLMTASEVRHQMIVSLSMSFIIHTEFDFKSSALLHYSGVLGYDQKTKRWRDPNDYTPMLAKLQYCMRVLVLEHALPQAERDYLSSEGSHPLKMFKEVRNRRLVQNLVFDNLHKLLQYGMSATDSVLVLKWLGGRTVKLCSWMAGRCTYGIC